MQLMFENSPKLVYVFMKKCPLKFVKSLNKLAQTVNRVNDEILTVLKSISLWFLGIFSWNLAQRQTETCSAAILFQILSTDMFAKIFFWHIAKNCLNFSKPKNHQPMKESSRNLPKQNGKQLSTTHENFSSKGSFSNELFQFKVLKNKKTLYYGVLQLR